jgi:hypothetical protein
MKHLLKTVLVLITVFAAVSCSNGTTGSSSSSSGGTDPNIAVNPSFESGLTGWAETGIGTGYVTNTNESANGSQSAYILCTSINMTNGIDQYLSYSANHTYVLSASLKDIVGPLKIVMIELCDSSSNRLSTPFTNLLTLTGWNGWTNVSITLAPTNLTGFVRIAFQVFKRSTLVSELFVDSVVLTNY